MVKGEKMVQEDGDAPRITPISLIAQFACTLHFLLALH